MRAHKDAPPIVAHLLLGLLGGLLVLLLPPLLLLLLLLASCSAPLGPTSLVMPSASPVPLALSSAGASVARTPHADTGGARARSFSRYSTALACSRWHIR